MTPIVTTCDKNFLPGLKALYNSYLRNSKEGFSFHCIVEGTQELADQIEAMGIGVILNPKFPSDNYPTSSVYPNPLPLYWWRLLVPSLFPDHEKTIFMDADMLILQNLQPLVDVDQGDNVVAATRCNGPKSKDIGGLSWTEDQTYGPMSSLYIFNNKQFFEKRILERTADAMDNPPDGITFITIAQAAATWVIGDDWHCLPYHNQAHAGHDTYWTYPRNEIYVMHFLGTNPWCEFNKDVYPTGQKLATRELWATYA
jgi:lipopolysaccharide biosynthesis glycosyltransferase